MVLYEIVIVCVLYCTFMTLVHHVASNNVKEHYACWLRSKGAFINFLFQNIRSGIYTQLWFFFSFYSKDLEMVMEHFTFSAFSYDHVHCGLLHHLRTTLHGPVYSAQNIFCIFFLNTFQKFSSNLPDIWLKHGYSNININQ